MTEKRLISPGLAGLTEDVLVYIVSFLEPPEILRLSETCKALHDITSLRIIWHNACVAHVLGRGYPFPTADVATLDEIPTNELISATLHAWALAQRWKNGLFGPRRVRYISGTSGTLVSDVKFFPGRKGRLVVTISKIVWSALTVWRLGDNRVEERPRNDIEGSRKVCEWSPRGAIFNGFVVNEDPKSPAAFALSVHLNEEQSVKILKLMPDVNESYSLEELYSVDTDMRPVTLTGDLLALSNDVSQTAIWNWREGTYAILEHSNDDPSIVQSNECHQVVFAHESVLVARARSIHLFQFPNLDRPSEGGSTPTPYPPIASHSFGWVDGQSIALCPFLHATLDEERIGESTSWQPLSILVRRESDDPWSPDVHHVDLYILNPNPRFEPSAEDDDRDAIRDAADSSTTNFLPSSPYLFPPRLYTEVPCLRGSLQCKQIILGNFGTAVWIQPRDSFPAGLVHDIPRHLIPPTDAHETVIMATFSEPLSSATSSEINGSVDAVVERRKIFANEFNTTWTSLDYDEVGGRVVLGSSFGRVVVLEI